MLGKKLRSWINESGWLDKVEATFEKNSGWKAKDLKSTLRNFSRLSAKDRALFGGLLVGRALFPSTTPERPKKSQVASPPPPAPSVPSAEPAPLN